MWMIRAGSGSKNIEQFVEQKVVALGDLKLGALQSTISKEEMLKLYAKHYPDVAEATRATWASQLVRFVTELKIGDDVVTYDREHRRYVLGKVASEYEWLPKLIADMPHARRISWTHEVLRDQLSTPTRNTLGAIQTLFKLGNDAAKELHAHAVPLGASSSKPEAPQKASPPGDEAAFANLVEETIEKADEFIEDAINGLDWLQMQHLFAGLLRAMGYRTTVSEGGSDRGVDIFASPDGLGLQEPRIFVEVKHRNAPIGSKEIRAFLGGRKQGDKCLYVSTGGFSKDAHYEADRADVAMRLISLPMLRKLFLEHYEDIDAETRALVPLRRLYWPVAKT